MENSFAKKDGLYVNLKAKGGNSKQKDSGRWSHGAMYTTEEFYK